ncbi:MULTISPECIES: response regulator transcription factor [Cysteiniphilum]|uniref:response regulator transcription factor n=1 Tax=Cysteiniphilum TaxID=2056696 RepID=UPI001781318A|nr:MULTISPECIES: response regulator transcription factor [Cysteiniphilum]
MSKVILVVDDDKEICSQLAEILKRESYLVRRAHDTLSAELAIKTHHPDLMLLDIMMPGESGIDFCRRVHESYKTPIIMVTASSELIDEVLAYEFGADDYICKPFNSKLLLAKIKTALRHYGHSKSVDVRYILFNGWAVDMAEKNLVSPEMRVKELALSEYKLLIALIQHQGQILSRDELIRAVYNREFDGYNRAIDVAISRIRKKFGDTGEDKRIIKTVSGYGYMFLPEVTHSQQLKYMSVNESTTL